MKTIKVNEKLKKNYNINTTYMILVDTPNLQQMSIK